jgi:hypothetical protein
MSENLTALGTAGWRAACSMLPSARPAQQCHLTAALLGRSVQDQAAVHAAAGMCQVMAGCNMSCVRTMPEYGSKLPAALQLTMHCQYTALGCLMHQLQNALPTQPMPVCQHSSMHMLAQHSALWAPDCQCWTERKHTYHCPCRAWQLSQAGWFTTTHQSTGL